MAGGERGVALYLAKRHLGLGPEQWDALPWWTRELYWQGLQAEFLEGQEHEQETEGDEDSGDADIIDIQSRGFGVRVVS